MNKLQEKELEILKCFIHVCEKLNLHYYLVCGSVLGAVKYKGFIPWDDDIDVGLSRDDYEIFLERANEFLPKNIFLQNYRTDPQFPHVFSKLRNSETTFIEKGSAHLNINHGIYIDVFPLDGYPEDAKEIKKLNRKKRSLLRKQYCSLKGGNWKVCLRNPFFRLLGYHKKTAQTVKKLEETISRYPASTSSVWCNHGNWQGKLEYAPRWHYGDGTEAEFEGIKVRIPENFDAYLTQKYGDWRADLPDDEKKSHHDNIVCDLEKPYTEFIKI